MIASHRTPLVNAGGWRQILQAFQTDQRPRIVLGAVRAAFAKHAALATALLAILVAYVGVLPAPIDNALFDWRAHLAQRSPTGDVVVVVIDTHSLRRSEQWPWPRSHFARAVNNLRAAGAGLIGFDVDFSARSSAADDDALRSAIDVDPGTVVLPTFLQPGGEQNTPLAALSANAVLGSVNIIIDPDGRVRRYNLGFRNGDTYRASMAAVLANARYGDDGQFLIDYGIRNQEIDRLSFDDVLNGAFDPARVRGKTILIGSTALELGDEFSTPVRTDMPGVFVHALAFESLAQGRALTQTRDEVALVLALVVLLMLWPRRAPLDLKATLIRHGAIFAVLILGPLAIQIATPVSLDTGLAILVQAICVLVAVQRELGFRAAELARQREDHLRFIAFHDPETQLPNRRALLDDAGDLLAGMPSPVMAVVVIGVDRFPTLRGAIGYTNANLLVARLASHLSQSLGSTIVYHLSTSILGLIIPARDAMEAEQSCDNILQTLSLDIPIGGQEIDIGVRIGAAVAGDGVSAERLLEQATIALDHARLRNRRRMLHNDVDAPDPMIQIALISDMRRGVARNEFNLVYQAKMSLREPKIVGAEALLRWRHPAHGDMSPATFIPVAEDTGAIHHLTEWVLDRAIDDQIRLLRTGVDVGFSVNLSARSLVDVDFCKRAIHSIRKAGASICFEITETAIIDDPAAAIASIAAFHEAGIRISIDDYGSGLSSLAYLKQIAADEIKLDKSLIDDLNTSARDRLIFRSTVDLAHGLGMSVIAEGIEDQGVLALAASMGCDAVQGFAVAKPLPFEKFAEFCTAFATHGAQASAQKSIRRL